MSQFGQRLRKLREEKGLTQKQLAEKSGLHSQAIVKLEASDREPAWSTVVALADALGVSTEAFRELPTTKKPAGRGRPKKAE